MYRYFKKVGSSHDISAQKSKGFSDESITPPAMSNNGLSPSLNYTGTKARVKFEGLC